ERVGPEVSVQEPVRALVEEEEVLVAEQGRHAVEHLVARRGRLDLAGGAGVGARRGHVLSSGSWAWGSRRSEAGAGRVRASRSRTANTAGSANASSRVLAKRRRQFGRSRWVPGTFWGRSSSQRSSKVARTTWAGVRASHS